VTPIASGRELVAVLGGRRIGDYADVLELHLTREEASWTFLLTLRLATSDRTRELVIRLAGVRDFHVSKSGLHGVGGLFLDDIRDRQWDGVRWELGDCEAERSLGCHASDLEVEVREGLTP